MSSSFLGPTILSALDNGTGIDVQNLVSETIAVEAAPLTLMEQQQSAFTSQATALQSLGTDLQSLQTAIDALTGAASQFSAAQATSSDNTVLTASAANGTPNAAHSVTVANLASTSSYYTGALATSATPTGTGTFNIKVGTAAAVPITVTSSNNTLAGIAATINGTKNIGVTASVITDASGARLAIVANASGAPGDLTVSGDTVNLGFVKSSPGTNASLNVDGVPISSSTNTVASVIPGVTLNLLGPTAPGETVSVVVGPDPTQAVAAVNTFVSAYNKVVGDLNAQFTIDPTSGQAGPLASDSSLSIVQSQILQAAAFSTTGNNGIVNLESLGVSLANDGTLSVNSGTLNAALQTNFSAVQNFFQSAASGFGQNFDAQLTALTDPATGVIASDLLGVNQSQQSLTQQISDFQAQLTTQQQTLTAQYSQINSELELLPLMKAQITGQLGTLAS